MLILWTLISAIVGHFTVARDSSIVQFVSHGVAWPIACAAGFLILVLAAFRWPDIGLRRFSVPRALRLVWLPAVYLCVFAAMLAVVGMPPAGVVLFIAFNACLVGFSEEVMFRGVLFGALRSRFGLWTSFWICCAAFGLIHVLNALQTGHLAAAVLQAVAAFMTGTMFMAVRLRTGSLYPVIILHAVWDCLPLLIATHVDSVNPDQPLSPMTYLAPLLVLPNLLYAVYLLRPKALARMAPG
ncbi:MAG: CPBP family intramembrane glutamic endopeptidase [Rhizobium sp.]